MSLYFNHAPCVCRLSSTFYKSLPWHSGNIPHRRLSPKPAPTCSIASTLRRCLRFPPKAKGSGDIRCGKPFPFRWHSVITAVILVTEYVYFPNRLPKRAAKDRSPTIRDLAAINRQLPAIFPRGVLSKGNSPNCGQPRVAK